MEQRKANIQGNLNKIKAQLETATLVAVSKTFPAKDIELAYELGQRDFGENKIQELELKAKELSKRCPDIRWHMIGHIQSNKLNKLAETPNLFAIHSIDSAKLYKKILKKQTLANKKLFLQINTSGEKEKFGLESEEELKELYQLHKPFGLMTMGPIRSENKEEDTRTCFQKLRQIRDSLDQSLKLSMGMSGDYLLAIELGTDYVRIGSSIFGHR